VKVWSFPKISSNLIVQVLPGVMPNRGPKRLQVGMGAANPAAIRA
jgi:hypothetical protein